ncbi:hypothetical protein ACI75Y_05625 [Capnocytophaga stomatis]|uniref:hypothetical protein n=1 Tax=Capnocytophaga stomatis TaxID=1848904 RepID=UPI00385C4EFB
MVKKFLLFAFILLFLSCYKQTVESLTMQRKPYLGKELRTDGYYYSLSDPWGGNGIFVFNRNGVCLQVFISRKEKNILSIIENEILLNPEFIKKAKEEPHSYGVFLINYPNIETETFIGRSTYRQYHTIEEILNDTTFVIHKEKGLGNKWFDSNTTYHFKKFSPKPDSTNVYIK